jgi:hypothetical protein
MRIKRWPVYAGIFLLLIGCRFPDGKERQIKSAADLYVTCVFTRDDSLPEANCLLQFSKEKDKKGLYLPRGAGIALDGQSLSADSTAIGEVYYEKQLSVFSFVGMHRLQLSEEKEKPITEAISITPVNVLTDFPAQWKRADITIRFAGLSKKDRLRLDLIDTSFATNDVHIDTLLNEGTLLINNSLLRNLADGPLTVYLVIEKRLSLHELRGEVVVRYVFRRETELTN